MSKQIRRKEINTNQIITQEHIALPASGGIFAFLFVGNQNLGPPPFTEGPVPSQERERTCISVLILPPSANIYFGL